MLFLQGIESHSSSPQPVATSTKHSFTRELFEACVGHSWFLQCRPRAARPRNATPYSHTQQIPQMDTPPLSFLLRQFTLQGCRWVARPALLSLPSVQRMLLQGISQTRVPSDTHYPAVFLGSYWQTEIVSSRVIIRLCQSMDRLCGVVVILLGCYPRGPGFDSRR
jgi:hypothetical protein